MALPGPVVRTPVSPLLRLPAELRLRIDIEIVGDGPEPSRTPSYCCLEGFTVGFFENQYALFDIPSFASLAQQYPHAFTQSEAIIIAQDIRDAQAHYRGHPHSLTKEEQGVWPENHYICSGVSDQEPMRSIVEAIKKPVHLSKRDWSHESIGWAKHLPTLAIADTKTVKLITNELRRSPLILILRELAEYHRLSTFKKMKLCVLVQRERVGQGDEGFYDLLSTDDKQRKKGASSVRFVLGSMPKEGQELEEVELEVHDQRGKGGEQRVIRVEFRKVMSRNGHLLWT